jgi:hypothetical protein
MVFLMKRFTQEGQGRDVNYYRLNLFIYNIVNFFIPLLLKISISFFRRRAAMRVLAHLPDRLEYYSRGPEYAQGQ